MTKSQVYELLIEKSETLTKVEIIESICNVFDIDSLVELLEELESLENN